MRPEIGIYKNRDNTLTVGNA